MIAEVQDVDEYALALSCRFEVRVAVSESSVRWSCSESGYLSKGKANEPDSSFLKAFQQSKATESASFFKKLHVIPQHTAWLAGLL